MKRIISSVITLALTLSLFPAFANTNAAASETVSNTVSGYVSAVGGDIEIASKTKAPKIYVDENDFAGVIRAAGDLQSDIKAVTGAEVTIVNDASDANIIIGTIGKSGAVDGLILSGSLDVSEINGEWEAFTLQNIGGKLVIVGADKRGTIYGIYDLSEKMGVSPWEWWADVTPQHSDAIYVTLPAGGYTEGPSSVKYRGIFINQEWNLYNWSKSLASESETNKGMNEETYKRIFELLLRLKANYMWPAMHEYSPAFNNNPNNAKNADEYGIMMATSHCEMLLRNNMGELLDFQERWIAANPEKKLYMFKDNSLNAEVAYDYTDVDKEGNHVYNKEFLEAYWRERVRANKDYESNFTIGMRGVHDGEWNPINAKTNAEKIELLEEIIAKQRQILTEEIGKPIEEIPQTFIPYKEILPIYNAGLTVPDDVTIMWTNDNYGHVRQTANAAEQARSGGGGMYYHVSYFGRPSSVIWNGGSQLGLIKEEMTKAYDCGADTIWVLNVGPLKPFENQMEYFLDLGRNIGKVRETKVSDYVKDNAKRYFGFTETQAQEYTDIQCEFLEAVNARRPEFQVQGIYSLTAYGDEGQKIVDKYTDLLNRSTALYNTLSDDLKPAFYELQLYAVRSAYDVINNYIGADKSVLYKSQGRGGNVNKYAKQSTDGRTAIDTDTAQYNNMLSGKWNNLINPFQTKEHGSWDIKIGGAASETVSELGYTDMGVAVENQTDINVIPSLEFSGYTRDFRFIDIFNKGTGSFDWEATADVDWIIFNKARGTVYDDDRIYAGIDWTKAPTGENRAKITVTRYIGDNAVKSQQIDVTLNNSVKDLPEKTYAEANGYVSIEAEHYTKSVTSDDYEWQEQDDFGRSGNSMKLMPNGGASLSNNSVYLEYDVNFDTTGTFDVDVYRMPTLNERGSVNCAVGIDEAAATTLVGRNTFYNNSNGTDAWGKGILNNVEVLETKITVNEAGIHKIRLYGVDTGTVIDKIVITTGTKYASFYGAPESYNTTYNNGGAITEEITPGVVTGNEPKLITDYKNGTGIIAVYESNGALSSVQTSDNYAYGAYIFEKPVNPSNDETVKGMVWSSLDEMEPLAGVYGKSHTIIHSEDNPMPEAKDAATEITGNIKALFEPALHISGLNTEESKITGVDVIKIGNASSAQIAVVAYDADGIMLDSETVTGNFADSQTNEKVTVPIDFEIPSGAAEIQAIAYDSTETLNALSPVYTVDKTAISLMAAYDGGTITVRSGLDEYKGKEAICRITDDNTGDEVYIRQEIISDDTFKTITTGTLNGTYTINIGIANEGIVVSEKAYTAVNITPDNSEKTTSLYTWDFSDAAQTAANGKNIPVISGNAVYDSDNKVIKMTSTDSSGGKLDVTFDEPVQAASGQKITVVSKIAYGRQDGKYMDYIIKDSDGNELIKSHINIYSSTASQSLQIGGVEKLESGIPAGIATNNKNNDGLQNGYSTFEATLDPDTNTITLVVSNAEGESTFTGKFPEGSSYDLGALSFSTTQTYASRSCYVDDISVTKTTAPSYTMTFDIKDTEGNAVTNPTIIVTDKKYNTVILPESEGSYHLTGGVYSYTITAEGYETVTDELELNPATPSNTISVRMTSGGGQPSEGDKTASITIQYRDEENNKIKDDVVLTEKYSDGDTYTVAETLKKDFVIKTETGYYNLYKFNESTSDNEVSFAEIMTVILKFNNTNQYDYYEDFEELSVDTTNTAKWHLGSGSADPTIESDKTKYLKQSTPGNSSTGAYMTFDEVDTANKKVKITADIKFEVSTGTGLGQFAISDSTPSFSSNNINNGIYSSSSNTKSEGHVLALMYRPGKALTVNGESVDTGIAAGSWVHIEADADCANKTITIKLTSEDGKSWESGETDFFSSSINDNIGSIYLRSPGKGAVSVDNVTVTVTGDANLVSKNPDSPLSYKSVYAFGDSIVYGHTAPTQSFMRLIANDYAMNLNMMAKNGATIMSSSNQILTQIKNAPADAPDFVVFEGYTNDAYGSAASDSFNSDGTHADVTQHYGDITPNNTTTFDTSTFCGSFENTIYTMKQKWPDSKVVFITIHKSGARNFDIQTKLHDLTVEMCEKWGVVVVDMFKDSTLDTRNSTQMYNYMIDHKGSHPNITACREFYIPAIVAKLESLCGDTPSETEKPQETQQPQETEKPQETEQPIEGTVRKFDFGGEGAADGYTAVSADRSYTDNLDYGFIGIKYDDYKLAAGEYMDGFRTVKGQQIELENGTRTGEGADSDFVAVKDEQNPLRFTMEAENGGYYHVKVKLVNASDSEKATVSLFGERSHLLLTNKEIEPGGELTYEFNADVETYYRKALNGKYTDDTLSIELTGKNAAIASMEVTKLDKMGSRRLNRLRPVA